MIDQQQQPKGKLAIRTIAMPADTNPSGNIFGGWVVAQMDLAGLSVARSYAKDHVATVAIDSLHFIAPVAVGDFVCCHVDLIKLGTTSIHVDIETWAIAFNEVHRRKVTQGRFVYVSLDDRQQPIPIIKGTVAS